MEKNKKINRKNERGAITLFVLLACLFFVFILTGVYVYNLNKMQTQEQNIKQIQENYARDINNIDEIYNELSKSIKLELTQEPENGIWSQEVTLIGNAEVKEGKIVTIEEYAFSKDSTDETMLEWEIADNGERITETTKVTEGGTYYFWVKDSEGEIYQSNPVEVTNIDRTEPTAGSIVAKEENASGEEYDLTKSPWTDKSVYVEKVDGTDGESGHGETTYTVKKDGITIHENIKDPVILEESGIYQIVVTTKDNAGNEATSKPYEIKIDKVVPVLALKHNDANGEDYDGTWTKDDLYGEVNIDTSSTGKSVEKYQYSYNGVIWNDISSEIVPTSIDYTTTFPMNEDKPEWINGPINNGDYYFEVQEDGTLKPTNGGSTGNDNKNTVANSYFEIDLTDYPEAELQITINATISSEGADRGYATITTSETAPLYNSTDGRFIYVSGSTKTEDHTTTLTGGQKYYLHIGYRKDGSVSSNQDMFIINSIRLQSETLGSNINFTEYRKEGNKITFKLQEDVEEEIYIRAVYTDGTTSKYGDKTTIKIDKTAPVIENLNIEITSITEAKVDIKVTEDASGMRGYYISTENTEPTEENNWVEQSLKEFTIEGLNTDTIYYLWLIDNVGNISERQEVIIEKVNYQIDGKEIAVTLQEAIEKASDGSTIELLNDYTDTSTATFSKNITFDVQGYTLTRDKTITINSGKEVEITGTGKITSEVNNIDTITNNGTLTISDSLTIENMSTSSSYAPIYTNNSNSITNINDNVQIIGNYRGIYNSNGTVNINGGKIEATYEGSSAYGIYNYSRTTVKTYINSGEIKGYYGIYNGSSSTLEITGGKIIGTGAYGVYAYGTTNVYGGRIEGKTYGVYSNSTDKVTIGREEDELSTTQPAIYGANYGIYMSNTTYSFNFYNGVIISNTRKTAYRGQVNLRTGHMTYTYIDYEVEQKYCTVLTPTVGNIEMKVEPTEYTNKNVTVTITYPYTQGITREYSEDGTEWKQADEYVQEVIVEENRTIYARTINESGVIIEEKQIEVTNIDKEKPTVEVTPSQTKYTVIETNGTIDLNITIKAQDSGVSGLNQMQYAWIEEGKTPSYIDFTNEITINKTKLKLGTYYLYINVTDKAGNKADIEQIRYTVEYQEPVAQIGDTKYLTIQEAIEACSKTAGETQTTIEILKSTDEEFSTYEGQNIILDLKGNTIGSSNSNTPICTNNGTLQIVDTSTEKTGKLESLNGTAIENKGTLTIGDNGTEIEMEVPTIYGKQIGIKNEYILNFYDGKIQGTAPIQGNVTNTPAEYGPVSTNYENGITTIQLGVVSGYEARIEWVYYTTVQEAIDATQIYKDGYKDTVTIIKNIQLNEILEINSIKNVILDLNGYELTVVDGNNRVINNYGNLEITDSSVEETGVLTITSTSTCYGIYNNEKGKVIVSKGDIKSTFYGIYNNSSEDIEIRGGNIYCTSTNYVYGIYNNNGGDIIIEGGNISNTNTTNNSSYGIYNRYGNIFINKGEITSISGSSNYGIYNANDGNVIITDGIVQAVYYGNSSSYSYGIYNAKNGNIIVKGGEVTSSTKYSYYASNAIYNEKDGSVIIEGGVLNAKGANSVFGIVNKGKLEMNGGVIKGGEATYGGKGIRNIDNGIVEINGGEIYGIRSTSIYNEDSGKIIINDGIIRSSDIRSSSASNSSSVYNASNGEIIIRGGEFYCVGDGATVYGVYNNSDGTIIIGNKEDGQLSNQTPNIKAEYTGTSSSYNGYGVYNSIGIIEFYDGIIQGSSNALYGNIGKIEDGCKLEEKEVDGNDAIYLVNNTEKENIVQVDNTKYTALSEAIDSIGENEEKKIVVLKDFEISEPVLFNKNIILDLNGKKVTNKYYRIENINNLTITDSSLEESGLIETTVNPAILNSENKINISRGNINCSDITYGIYNKYGDIEITGGNITFNNTSYGIFNANNGNIKIINGTVECTSTYAIYNNDVGSIEVTGGTVSIKNRTTSGTTYGIYNSSGGNIEIRGGMINSNNGYSSDGYGIYNSSGNVKVTGGTISSKSSSNSSSSRRSCGIYNNNGNIEVTGGTLSSSSSRNNYGIYNYNTGNIIIGIKGDGIVLQEEPYIYGEYTGTSSSYVGYGIYNTKGKLYYYDGKLEGSTKAVYDIITEREENTELNYNEDETTLTLSTTITDVAQIGNTTYPTLQEAIETVGTEQTTIKLLRNVTYTSQDIEIIISGGKNIILDLNGYKITSAIPEQAIKNEGILEVIDTSEGQTGIITTTEETTVKNVEGAKLSISGGTIENRTTQSIHNQGELIIAKGTINGNINGIYNDGNGIVKVTGGTVSSSYNYGIYNNNNGSIEVTDGTVKGAYGIYNNGNGTVKVNGGIIDSNINSVYSYGIYNNNNGNVRVTGGTVSGRYGIYNYDNGTIEVTGGTVSSNSRISGGSYGIYNCSTGNIIIGIKGDGQISQEEPYINGSYTSTSDSYISYGIYNKEGNLYYYDGKIEGSTRGIYGNITEIEEKAELLISRDSTEVIQLEAKETNVAKVNGTEYDSIQKAIQACGQTESTIEILRNAEPGATLIIEEVQNITINLNGYTFNNYTELQNKGMLKIVDSSAEKNGKIKSEYGIAVLNSGTMTVESGGISNSGYGIQNNGTLNIEGGNITNNTYGIYNDGTGIVTITGGNINTNTYGVYNYSGKVDIETSGIINNDYGIYIAGGTTNIKEGAEIQSNVGIYNAKGRLNIGDTGTMNPDSPIITGETYGLVNLATGTTYMYDGQVKGKEGATQGYITYAESGYAVSNKVEGEYSIDYLVLAGTVETVAEVNEIAFSNLQSAINSVIGEEAQTVKLTNGVILNSTLHISEGQNIILDMNGKTINSDTDITIQNAGNLTIIDSSLSGVGKISSTVGVAIENSGTLTLGQDDGTISQDLITIEGNTYGIINSGTLNFYDGTMNGASAIQGVITDRPEGYVIRITTVNGKERYYLSI